MSRRFPGSNSAVLWSQARLGWSSRMISWSIYIVPSRIADNNEMKKSGDLRGWSIPHYHI